MLRGAVVPHLLGAAEDPGGAPIEVFDQLRAGLADRSEFCRGLAEPWPTPSWPGASSQREAGFTWLSRAAASCGVSGPSTRSVGSISG
ncbi:hypothetical protein GCM10010435_79480 [Winogradskya consettensis]|uniref:Uncharacterized protein n=1 Tax=Winogradskya consettensis TaxID=113560 RepID=A0A919SSC1_9ACTN|nr:hypothetical protein Aco04nite_55480 [Actinoplanes consettensis]